MATVTILQIWTAKFPESKEFKYVKDGQQHVVEARPERTATIAQVQASDETINQIELPEGYSEKIEPGDTLQLTVPDWPDAPFRSRNITRHIKAPKK